VNERRAQTPVQTSAGEPAPRDAGLAGRAPTMRPPMKWFEIIVGVITAGSAAVALFFASRTVSQARAAAEEIRRDRAERRLERILELVANIRLANQDSNRVLSGMHQGQLKPLDLGSTRFPAGSRRTGRVAPTASKASTTWRPASCSRTRSSRGAREAQGSSTVFRERAMRTYWIRCGLIGGLVAHAASRTR
jgi:hypothetical protein